MDFFPDQKQTFAFELIPLNNQKYISDLTRRGTSCLIFFLFSYFSFFFFFFFSHVLVLYLYDTSDQGQDARIAS